MRKGNNVLTVWVGFTDGKPHKMAFYGDKNPDYTVCSTKKLALSMYEDARKAYLVWPATPKRKRQKRS